MTNRLVFTLSASMASMGDLAGHERRGTLAWPGRSAILGLMAAAMGISRDDENALKKLEDFRVAVAAIDIGQPLRDYHTIETIPAAVVKNPPTRAHALCAPPSKTKTTITLRDYRSGVIYAIAVWGADCHAIKDALEHPKFTLYFGRKSCPLSSPLAPKIVSSESILDALEQASIPPFLMAKKMLFVASDERISLEDIKEVRNDVAIDRAKWHFTQRKVYIHHPEIGRIE